MASKLISATLLSIMFALGASAEEDVRKVQIAPPELKVIEEKCLVCHNKDLIDQAIKERKDREKVLQHMEKKGVVLTDAERQVMGHFWQQEPFREKEAHP